MTDRHPRVRKAAYDTWYADDAGPSRVVPLGGVHLYRDENGDWPSDADADLVRNAAEATGVSVQTAQFLIGEWLDALEAAAKGEHE